MLGLFMSHCKLTIVMQMKIDKLIPFFLPFLVLTSGVLSENNKSNPKKNEIAINVKHQNLLLSKSSDHEEKKSSKEKKSPANKEKDEKSTKNKSVENSKEKSHPKSEKGVALKENRKEKTEKEKIHKEAFLSSVKSNSEKDSLKKDRESLKEKKETISKSEKKESTPLLKNVALLENKPKLPDPTILPSSKSTETAQKTENKKIIETKKESPPKEEVTILSETYEELTFKESDFVISARANEFRQGNLGFIKIREPKGKGKFDPSIYSVRWNGVSISLHPFGDSFLGVLPISPEHPTGVSFLDLEKDDTEKTTIYKFPINIVGTNFPERKMYNPLRVPKKYIIKEHSPETLEFIKRCEEKKQQVFSLNTELKFNSKFVLPLDKIFVTSPFYVKRFYHPSSPGKPHGGVDLRGKPGVPIYAIQDGKVVIAERMFFEGIFTVIDHGSKIFTLYMHQSRIHVREGDIVKAGQLIGEVGSTGISTGPHLHLGLKVDGNMLNPLNVLKLSLF